VRHGWRERVSRGPSGPILSAKTTAGAKQQKGITSNVTSSHETSQTSTSTSDYRPTEHPLTRGIHVRDEVLIGRLSPLRGTTSMIMP
jgi:hypothetical protein